jgi:translation initiation factor 3 subunit H
MEVLPEDIPLTSGIQVVQLDGLVLLKIIKHCKENMPEVVTGQLLGLDVEDRLEVTNCFPFPSSDDNDDTTYQYQIEMMKCLRTVNVDNNTVGWYQTSFMGSFITTIIESQFAHQKEIPQSVVVVYDPFKTTKGRLALNAYRLTDGFMELYGKEDFSHLSFSKLEIDSSKIMEEVPIKIHNSHLVHGFLYELREHGSMSCDHDRLHLNNNPFLEKSLGMVSDLIDEYAAEQMKFQYWQRQSSKQKQQKQAAVQKWQAENDKREKAGQEPLPEEDWSKMYKVQTPPSRMDSVMVAGQIQHHSDQIIAATGQAFNKLYLRNALARTVRPQYSADDDKKE